MRDLICVGTDPTGLGQGANDRQPAAEGRLQGSRDAGRAQECAPGALPEREDYGQLSGLCPSL